MMLHDLELSEHFASSVLIVPEAIQEEYVRIPADLAYYNQRYADAYGAHAHAKVGLARLEALLRIRYRDELASTTSKVTESMVDAAVQGDVAFQDAQDALINADVARVTAQGQVDAVRTKRDMLISVGAHLRAEMAGDPSIRQQASAAKQYPPRS